MRLRTQLILATFLLAIVPLTAIVLYSYNSSRRALENAYRREAARMTRQMDTRLASIRSELETRLAGVSNVPLQSLPQDVVEAMSDVAPLVHSVEFQPEDNDVVEPPKPPEPMVVDIPSTTSDITEMSKDLAAQGGAMTDEQRKALTDKIRQHVVVRHKLSEEEKARVRDRARRIALLFGHPIMVPVQKQGKVVGHIAAQINPDDVIRRVLGTNTDDGEIPFAIDREGHFYTRNDQERATLSEIGLPQRATSTPDWIVVMKSAGENGLRVGVARRVGDDLGELRRTAGRNFGYGLVLVLVALIGIVPITNHMTRDVSAIAQGAERVAQGDLQTRVPVRSKNEVGQLAVAFNHMARQLSEHQQQLVEQRVLAVEYERKANELEEARRFQLSMLPKEVPRLERFDVAVFTQTATEVGGDYYDFHVSPAGDLTVAIGDATGHGAKAGTMVAVIKTLFSAYRDDTSPAAFLGDAAAKIKRMDLGRMAMALCIAKLEVNRLTIASAGMPPVLVHRASSNDVEELALEATPLGTLGTHYVERTIEVASGDTILFMSDGLPELTGASGSVQLGYVGAADAFANAARESTSQSVLDALVAAARAWHGDDAPNDDMTFVAVRVS